jgi:hypothetical protein
MSRYVLPIALSVILSCGPAMAQVAGQNDPSLASPLGVTSPLGLGPGSPVAPTGLPMGATELATPGISPPPDMSMVFDGGGMATSVGSLPTPTDSALTNPSASASAPMPATSAQMVGRPGIPLGSVELGGGGLSPLPDPTTALVPAVTPAAPSAFAAPIVSAPPTAMAAPSVSCPGTTGRFVGAAASGSC